jgi:hypothetical protein
MNAQAIRNQYLKFFEDRGHKVIPRAPLVLHNDPTTLFTGSGMQQLMPYLLGQDHPDGTRLVDSQTCIRAQDIEEVGDNRHTTFFEMLGNWSLGDYFKAEQFPWIFEFLTDVVGLDPKTPNPAKSGRSCLKPRVSKLARPKLAPRQMAIKRVWRRVLAFFITRPTKTGGIAAKTLPTCPWASRVDRPAKSSMNLTT